MAPKSTSSQSSGKGSKEPAIDKESEDYRQRRERNNVAVKKSREKSREKAKVTVDKVNLLKQENTDLETKVSMLSKELGLLKDLLLAHAGAGRRGAIHTQTATVASTNSVGPPPGEQRINRADPKSVRQDHEYATAQERKKFSP